MKHHGNVCVSSARSFFTLIPVILLLLFLVAPTPVAAGQDNNQCDQPGEEPDVIVSNIYETRRWGETDDITSFSIGTYSCNMGTCWLNWFPNNNQHPVISGNMYRLKNDRFEQIGQSWLKHGFYALSGNLCGGGCIDTDGTHLGVRCSDPYSAGLNGEQDRLGPKFEVNPYTGEFPYPATDLFLQGNVIYKRLQVHNDDLNPVLNEEARYFVDSQYVTADDAAAGNQNNNSSYREVNVTGSNGNYNISLTGSTQLEMPGIVAWADADPTVELTVVSASNDGLFFVAAKVTPLLGGIWHYEYAIQNLNSHRAAREFSLPILPVANVTNIGFTDVVYHSGEPYDGTDWPGVVQDTGVPYRLVWSTDTYGQNPDANALRWDTLYNFRFDVDLPPEPGQAKLGLFRSGFPSFLTVSTLVPAMCNADGFCDLGEAMCECTEDCTPAPIESFCQDGLDDDCDSLTDCFDPDCCVGSECDSYDVDQDSFGVCDDCNDRDEDLWGTPGEVRDVGFTEIFGTIVLSWSPPLDLGGDSVEYETIRSTDVADFMTDPTCLISGSPGSTFYMDLDDPDPDELFCYLVRAQNACPVGGEGGVGTNSDDEPRAAVSCP